MKKTVFLLFSLLFVVVEVKTNTRFASIFTDNMVLQQKSTIKIWGYSDPKEKITVTVSWIDKIYSTTTDEDGKWLVSVKTPAAKFHEQRITVIDSRKIQSQLNNILIGEVWLCSGQSNMEMVLMSMPEWNMLIENSATEIATANYPYIRFLTIPRKECFAPQSEISATNWKICTPDNAKWFSAVSYFFGKKIYQELHVPVGLIVSSYGGSPVQSWLPNGVIDHKELYKSEKQNRLSELKVSTQTEDEYIKAMTEWINQSEKSTTINSTPNIILNLPVNLENSKIGNQLGEVLFSKKIYLPENNGKSIHVSLGRIDDLGRVYFNGELVWKEVRNSKSYSDIQFDIPANKIKSGENIIEVKVLNVLWGGGLTGPADKMYYTIGEKTQTISLAGNWEYSKIFNMSEVFPIPREGKATFLTASSLYNGMINPLLDYKVKGCLWYQGEANVGDPYYAEMLSDMIAAWRQMFRQKLPFYLVQIAPFNYGEPNGDKSVLLRNMQAMVGKTIPKTYVALTLDIGEADNIHPAKKREVGERLSSLALKNAYQKHIQCNYPEVKSVKLKNGSIILNIKNTYNGLSALNAKHAMKISEDGINFVTASVEVLKDKILVHADRLLAPKYIRYCWTNVSTSTIHNSAGLPLPSFKIELK